MIGLSWMKTWINSQFIIDMNTMDDLGDFIVFDTFFGGGSSSGSGGNQGCGCILILVIVFLLLSFLGMLTDLFFQEGSGEGFLILLCG